MNRLSAHQIKVYDEFAHDTVATEKTLKVALTYHANRMSELNKVKQKFWVELIEQYNLDSDLIYHIKIVDGIACIVEQEKEDE